MEAQAQSIDSLLEQIEQYAVQALSELSGCESSPQLEQVRLSYMGREQGKLNLLRRHIKDLIPSDRPRLGAAINQACDRLESALTERTGAVKELELNAFLREDSVDVTIPGRCLQLGRIHPLQRVLDEIIDIWVGMGFEVVEGPEIETEFYNFDALNTPADHPARDSQDTLYLPDGYLLRTHTSPVQIRTMETRTPPLRVISPGRVYRRDAVTSRHSPIFHQVEGFMVAPDVTFSDLKGVLTHFVHQFLGESLKVKFTPSFFPFTEPSAEMSAQCIFCIGKGCRVCSQSGWFEVLGAGMIDPNVMQAVNYDAEALSGFAFGMGLERIAMIKYQIDNIRLFYDNHLAFNRQAMR